MRIYHEIPDNIDLFKNPVITIGSFDGIHIGHQKIFSTVKNIAKKINGDPVVISFSAHPRKILNPEYNMEMLTSNQEKIRLIYAIGIPNIILLRFSREMSGMSAHDFLNKIIIKKIDAQHIVLGYDHAFGKNREGTVEFLKRFSEASGIAVTRVPEMDYNGSPVSSTWIRNEIRSGNMDLAMKLLGRRYSLEGRVIRGSGRGKKLGFPTANIEPDEKDKLIPAKGVYSVSINIEDIEGTFHGMMNIGTNPTFSGSGLSVEVNIFDFDADIYDSNISVKFYSRIRDEIKFSSPAELVKQIALDKIAAEKSFTSAEQHEAVNRRKLFLKT